MTGFGDAADHGGATHYAVEIRSINNRFFKAAVRLPDALAALESDIEKLLREHIGRGTITLTLHLKTDDAAGTLDINEAAIRHYLRPLADHAVGHPHYVIDLAHLVTLPGVLTDPAAAPSAEMEAHREPVLTLVRQAIDALLASRRREGASLKADLVKHLDDLEANLKLVELAAPKIVAEYHRKLAARVNELMAASELRVAEGDLIREVAVFAEKADVAEEINRLGHHLAQFRQTLDDPEPQVGRKLDFLTQEMLREANTIGSKSPDAQTAGYVIAIKGAIDRLKEQVQNVE
jgi:uncharacterized protein (TIGR00255 family)